MRQSRFSLRRSLLLSLLVVFSILAASALAQQDDPPPPPATTNDPPPPPQTTTRGNNNPPATTTNRNNPPTTTNGPQTSRITGATTNTRPANTPVTLPSISGPGGGPGTARLTGLPTLSRTADLSIPTYPPPGVPPTQRAPFMRHSSLPDGTVFIAVGAILGAFGVAVLVWRGIVACLLHRSVERAAMAQHHANDKAAFPAPPAPFYKYTDRDSSPNLAGAAGRGSRRTLRAPIPSATPSQSNLFFSPTASGAGMAGSGPRDSRFLPSGFYAAGAASPAMGHGHSMSSTNLRPDSRGNPRPVGHSPPDSPSFGPRATPVPRNVSTSSVNLNRPPSGRAPSAFLDDLLDDQPHLFPGAQHAHRHTHSQSSSRRGGY